MEVHVQLELKMLAIAAIIGLVQLLWAAAAANTQTGLAWYVGARDEPKPLTGMAARLQRAFANYRETFPIFAAVLLATYLAGKMGSLTVDGSILYVVARAVYVPLYAFGVPYVRSLVWGASLVGIVMVLAAFFQ
jgi:uncharacterized MAPEG superfamily protein